MENERVSQCVLQVYSLCLRNGKVLNHSGVEIDLPFRVFKRLKKLNLLERNHSQAVAQGRYPKFNRDPVLPSSYLYPPQKISAGTWG